MQVELALERAISLAEYHTDLRCSQHGPSNTSVVIGTAFVISYHNIRLQSHKLKFVVVWGYLWL